MQIGVLAKRAGLNPRTIRYYEQIGVLPPAPRTPSGYRQYTEQDRERLAFIRNAQALGLALVSCVSATMIPTSTMVVAWLLGGGYLLVLLGYVVAWKGNRKAYNHA